MGPSKLSLTYKSLNKGYGVDLRWHEKGPKNKKQLIIKINFRNNFLFLKKYIEFEYEQKNVLSILFLIIWCIIK